MSLLVSDLTGFLTEQSQRCRAADSEFLTNMRNILVAILKSAAQIYHSEYTAASQHRARVTNKENIIYTNLRPTAPHYDKAMFYILTAAQQI